MADWVSKQPDCNDREHLLHLVRTMQKRCQEGKQDWVAFCQKYCRNTRDPDRHSDITLHHFIEQWTQLNLDDDQGKEHGTWGEESWGPTNQQGGQGSTWSH